MLLEDVSAWLIYTTRYTDVLQLVFSCLCSVTNSVSILSFTEGSIQEMGLFLTGREVYKCALQHKWETAVCYHRHGKLTANAKAAAVLKCVQSWKAPEHDAVGGRDPERACRAAAFLDNSILPLMWKTSVFCFSSLPKRKQVQASLWGNHLWLFQNTLSEKYADWLLKLVNSIRSRLVNLEESI